MLFGLFCINKFQSDWTEKFSGKVMTDAESDMTSFMTWLFSGAFIVIKKICLPSHRSATQHRKIAMLLSK